TEREHIRVIAFIAKEFKDHKMSVPPSGRIETPSNILNGDILTSAHHRAILQSRSSASKIVCRSTPTTLPQVKRATSTNSRISCGGSWPCRTPKSRPNLRPKNEPSKGKSGLRLRPLPALQATVKVRRVTFGLPCPYQSDARKLNAFPQSEPLPS